MSGKQFDSSCPLGGKSLQFFKVQEECIGLSLALKVTGSSRSQPINYGSASELYLSQHDVMQDLSLYFASRDRIV